MLDRYEVVVGAGSLRSDDAHCVRFPHRWTPEGVTVSSAFTGAHLLHLAAAGCVLNDCYREAQALGLELDGVRVTASGAYDPDTWASLGVEYAVELATRATAGQQEELVAVVDQVAEVPRALRAGARVRRTHQL